jgi:hypothetical protein
LEELFDFPPSDTPEDAPTVEQTRTQLAEIDATIDKIDAALPTVRDLETGDQELDELASKATETFNDLMDLGMQVDSRYSGEIFAVASSNVGPCPNSQNNQAEQKIKNG